MDKYDVPKEKMPRYFSFKNRKFKGQSQKWFLAQFLGQDNDIDLTVHNQIEFTEWMWASYWHPVAAGVEFKKNAYRQVLTDFLPFYKDQMKVY